MFTRNKFCHSCCSKTYVFFLLLWNTKVEKLFLSKQVIFTVWIFFYVPYRILNNMRVTEFSTNKYCTKHTEYACESESYSIAPFLFSIKLKGEFMI